MSWQLCPVWISSHFLACILLVHLPLRSRTNKELMCDAALSSKAYHPTVSSVICCTYAESYVMLYKIGTVTYPCCVDMLYRGWFLTCNVKMSQPPLNLASVAPRRDVRPGVKFSKCTTTLTSWPPSRKKLGLLVHGCATIEFAIWRSLAHSGVMSGAGGFGVFFIWNLSTQAPRLHCTLLVEPVSQPSLLTIKQVWVSKVWNSIIFNDF